MVKVFRKNRSVPESKQLWLTVDGDKLPEEKEVQQCDIDDMDYIDVYIR